MCVDFLYSCYAIAHLVWLEYCMSRESDFAEKSAEDAQVFTRLVQVELAAYVLFFVSIPSHS